MRIGIDAHMLGDHSGGNENYYVNILNSLIDVEDDIFVFVYRGIDISSYNGKFNVVYFKSRNAFVRNFIEIPLLCHFYKLDLMHTQYFIPYIRPCAFVCVIHDICFEHFDNVFGKLETIRQRIHVPYAAKRSKIIFTVSEYSKNDIITHYKIPPNKILVTYNAVNSNYKPLPSNEINTSDLRNRFNIGCSPFILCVGNLQPRKNLVNLIRAYSKYRELYVCDTRLVIVGKKSWMYNDIISEAISNQYSNEIIFTDYVSEKDLIRLYNEATAFIYPSLFEGFGVPPLEAMACGTPVAVSNTSSLPEVIGKAGLYFDPYNVEEITDSIYKLMSDKRLRDKLICMGYEQVKRYSWAKAAEVWKKGYLLSQMED